MIRLIRRLLSPISNLIERFSRPPLTKPFLTETLTGRTFLAFETGLVVLNSGQKEDVKQIDPRTRIGYVLVHATSDGKLNVPAAGTCLFGHLGTVANTLNVAACYAPKNESDPYVMLSGTAILQPPRDIWRYVRAIIKTKIKST
jgi:hypothetical protein